MINDNNNATSTTNQELSPQSAASEAIADSPADKHQNSASSCHNPWRDPVPWLLLGTLLATAFAAIYAGEQSKTASDHERRSLRAYVGTVIPTELANHPLIPPAIPNFSISIKNFGQTPAYKVVMRTGFAVERYPLPADFDFAFRPENIRPIPVTVFPGATIGDGSEFPFPRPLTANEASRIQGGKDWRLYLYGTISYFDAFDHYRYTGFCVDVFVRDSRTNVWEQCEPHNNSD